MLTYSLSLNASVTILPLQKIAAAQFVHSFWNVNFNPELIENIIEDHELYFETELVDHREEVCCIMYVFLEENKLPTAIKTILKESLFSLCQAYCRMILWKRTYPFMRHNTLKEGELYAPNYLNVDGEFNDVIWAKHFVLDSSNRIDYRFYLACLYWFENETAELWPVLKRSNFVQYENILDDLHYPYPLITLRVFQLENQLDKLAQNRSYAGSFFQIGFTKAAENGYEKAAYYFWQKMSECEKRNIIEKDDFFELICTNIGYPDKLSCFLYSQLSKERKRKFLDWSIAGKRSGNWLFLLVSPYSQNVRFEIIEFIYQLPIKMCSKILELLALRLKEFKNPFDSEIFSILWINLTPEGKTFTLNKRGNCIIRNLILAKSFLNLSHILKPLSNEEKDKCLFANLYRAGVDALDILVMEDEFDMIQKYLLFFLVEIDPVTQKETLRKNANLLLKRFMQQPLFLQWCMNELTKEEKEVVNCQIAALQNNFVLSSILPAEISTKEDNCFVAGFEKECIVESAKFENPSLL